MSIIENNFEIIKHVFSCFANISMSVYQTEHWGYFEWKFKISKLDKQWQNSINFYPHSQYIFSLVWQGSNLQAVFACNHLHQIPQLYAIMHIVVCHGAEKSIAQATQCLYDWHWMMSQSMGMSDDAKCPKNREGYPGNHCWNDYPGDLYFNSSPQNGRNFTDNIFRGIFR